jgi:hypothetical protein
VVAGPFPEFPEHNKQQYRKTMKTIIIIVTAAITAIAIAGTGIKCRTCKGTGWDGSFKCTPCGGDGEY